MWSYYLDAMSKLANRSDGEQKLKKKLLAKAYQQAVESNHMSEAHYINYIALLYAKQDDEDFILNVIKKGNTTYPESVPIWESYLKYFIGKNDMAAVEDIFQKSKNLETKVPSIWQLYLFYIQAVPDTYRQIEDFFEEVVSQTDSVFNSMKGTYLDWAQTVGGLDYTRTVYNRTVSKSLACLEMHNKMAEFESLQVGVEHSS